MEQQTALSQLTSLKDDFNIFASLSHFMSETCAEACEILPLYKRARKKEAQAKADQFARNEANFIEYAAEADLVVEKLGKMVEMPEGLDKDMLASDVNVSLMWLQYGLQKQAAISDPEEAAVYQSYIQRVQTIKNTF